MLRFVGSAFAQNVAVVWVLCILRKKCCCGCSVEVTQPTPLHPQQHLFFENVVKPMVLDTFWWSKHQNAYKTNEKSMFLLPKWFQPGYWIPDTWYWIPDTWYLIPGYPIPDIWYQIPDTWYRIPDIWYPDTGYPIPDTWYLITDTRYLIPDTGYTIPDTRYQIPDTGYLIPDIWYQIPDTRYLISDIWHLGPDTWYLIPDIWYLISDTRYLVPDTRYLIPDIWFLIPDTRYLIPDTDTWYLISLDAWLLDALVAVVSHWIYISLSVWGLALGSFGIFRLFPKQVSDCRGSGATKGPSRSVAPVRCPRWRKMLLWCGFCAFYEKYVAVAAVRR